MYKASASEPRDTTFVSLQYFLLPAGLSVPPTILLERELSAVCGE
jgi:hypothetical protein